MLRQLFLIIGLLMLAISVFSQSKLTPKQISRRNYQEIVGLANNPTDTIELDKRPMYPDGVEGMRKQIMKNLSYPRNALYRGVQGRVILQFIVEKDGTIKKICIKQSADPELDLEAVRVLMKLKKFVPGYKDGQPVRVLYTWPFSFVL